MSGLRKGTAVRVLEPCLRAGRIGTVVGQSDEHGSRLIEVRLHGESGIYLVPNDLCERVKEVTNADLQG